jgi:3-hydroxy-9,10-secoandrosta-1,3,5(10)-triene-9,17-dione monooxygenase
MDLKQELVGRAHELRPVIAARAAATQEKRALVDDTVKDLCDAGFMQTLTPKRYGGHELHLDTVGEITRIISSACPSTGWVAAFYMGHNWFHAAFPERSQDEVFADRPYQLTSGQIAPTATAHRVPGGYQITGRQAWSSGVAHAQWVLFSGLVLEDGTEPEPALFLIPRENVEVIDNWFVAGMQGTGSSDVSVEDVFVPEYHTVSTAKFMDGSHPGASLHDNPMYRLPGATIKYFEAMPVMAGALRGAAEHFLDATRERIVAYTGTNAATKASTQLRLGRCFAAADALDDMIDAAAQKLMRYDGTRPLSIDERVSFRMRLGLITKMAGDAVSDIMEGAGGNAFRDSSALQRVFRDVSVIRTHAVLDYETACEIQGRVLLGMDPGTPVV